MADQKNDDAITRGRQVPVPVFDDERIIGALRRAGGGTPRQKEGWLQRVERELVTAERVVRDLDDPVLRDRVRHLRTLVSAWQSGEEPPVVWGGWMNLYWPDDDDPRANR